MLRSIWVYIKEFIRHYFGGLISRADEHHLFLLSGGLAFSLFVCIVPFVLVIFAVLSSILGNVSLQAQLSGFVDRIIPYDKYAAFVKEFIFSRVAEFKAYKNVAGYIGAIGLFLAASGLFSSMRTILDRVFVMDRPRRIWVGKVRDLGMVLLVLAFFLISTAILPGLDILKEMAGKTDLLKGFRFSGYQQVIITGLSYLAIYTVFFILYRLIPYARLGWRIPALAAFWAAVMWEVARQLFGYYMANIASLKQIYGAYMLIVVVAIWIYYSSMVFILGAEIGQLYRERRQKKLQTD